MEKIVIVLLALGYFWISYFISAKTKTFFGFRLKKKDKNRISTLLLFLTFFLVYFIYFSARAPIIIATTTLPPTTSIIFKSISFYGNYSELNIYTDIAFYSPSMGEFKYFNASLLCYFKNNPTLKCFTPYLGTICTIRNPAYNSTLDCSFNKCSSGLNFVVCNVSDNLNPSIKNSTITTFRAFDVSLAGKNVYSGIGKFTLEGRIENKGALDDAYKITWQLIAGSGVEVNLFNNQTSLLAPGSSERISGEIFVYYSSKKNLAIYANSTSSSNIYARLDIEIKDLKVSLADFDFNGIFQIILFSLIILLLILICGRRKEKVRR
ncbi:MAG: hypothetical protein QXG91_01315 [Candidatus Aenigmatarchaeota archaeon]